MNSFHLGSYLLFVSVEFGLIALALVLTRVRDRDYLLVAVVVLLMLPLFSYGPSNDAGLRLSVPALVILAILCIQVVSSRPVASASHLPVMLLGLVLAIGANTAINELSRALLFPRWQANYSFTLAERQGGVPAPHYAAHLNNPMLEFILKKPRIVPPSGQSQ